MAKAKKKPVFRTGEPPVVDYTPVTSRAPGVLTYAGELPKTPPFNADFYRSTISSGFCVSAEETASRPATHSTNDDRDKWMYGEKQAGKTHGEIRAALARHPEWDQLDTDQSVGRAIDRYCDRHGLPKVRRKR